MYAQEQPSLEGQLDKTYGYIKSHELLALKIQQNYPELAPRIVDGEVRGRIVIDVNA